MSQMTEEEFDETTKQILDELYHPPRGESHASIIGLALRLIYERGFHDGVIGGLKGEPDV